MINEPERFKLGLDLGSVSLNCVVTNSSDQIIYKKYRRTAGRPIETTQELFHELESHLGDCVLSGAVVTGSGKELISESMKINVVNEIIAHATAAWTLYPGVESIFEIGGQDSKYISIGRNDNGEHYLKDHAFNELCAAGTGAFLDQQAERLGLSIEEFSALAAATKEKANVAGRCSVFAKSDMIHLQQKAVPVAEIASGLCFALVRNFLATLCRGRIPSAPILFQGGLAANRGVIKAFREILNLTETELIVPDDYNLMGALGSAVIAGTKPLEKPISITNLSELLRNHNSPEKSDTRLKPLKISAQSADQSNRNHFVNTSEKPFFLGLDIGSVSTKGVITDSQKKLVASAYVPTAGRPIESLQTLFSELNSSIDPETYIAHTVSTGSGRYLSAALVSAGAVADEISAQAASCQHFFPDADTIIEIGGQDSKFIKLTNGQIESFKMNRACAAGTGAFLEEQAGRLKINISDEFSDMAFKATDPVKLGSRCTVFMDSDLVHHLQRGATTENLCAGLAYSVGENYLEKVVGSSPLGNSIIFQGGVAKNTAVKSVFEQLSGKTIETHPYPEISGALGASFIAQEEFAEESAKSGFFLKNKTFYATAESFDCQLCENSCDISKVTSADGKVACFGSVCGRFDKLLATSIVADDPFVLREKLLHEAVEPPHIAPFRGEIGLPLTLTLCDYLPFWQSFFNVLGFKTVLSEKTNRSIIENGLIQVPAEFCYPIKVLFGHVYDLGNKGLKTIFIPHLRMFTPPQEKSARFACPYTQAAPYIVRENISFDSDILTLEFPVEEEQGQWVDLAAEQLSIGRHEVQEALAAALSAQTRFSSACVKAGKDIIDQLARENRRGAVLLGRPYNTADRYVNLNLARKLQDLDIEPIPFDFLPLGDDPLPELWSRIRWGYGRKLVQGARVLKDKAFLGAVVVTNFGCGPDAFVDQYLEHELKNTPHVLIELDDHQAEAGLVTRLEAFSRNFKIDTRTSQTVAGKDPGKPRIPLREYTYYIPSFMDHTYAISGALKASGCKVVRLPPTDEESWNLGLKHAYGRECHPFISFVGDLLKATESSDFIPEKACYYGPSYFGPCLLPQYPLALHLILEKIGLQDVTVMNILDETNMKELGMSYMARMILGIYTIDRFFKWKTEIEPYEAQPGTVNIAYMEILEDLEQGLATGRFFKTLKKCTKKFQGVTLTSKDGTSPKIGIVGDVFTRVNEHSNNHLYRHLKEMGFEVWPACSLVDVGFLSLEQLHVNLLKQGKKVYGSAAKLLIPGVKIARWSVDRYFPDGLRTPQERDFHAVSQVSSKYIDLRIDKALALNISRIEELYLGGADGVINVMCHNCMLGTITASLTKTIRKDMDDIPICNLVYEGLKSTHNLNRLEAFTQQVKSGRKTF